jgi:hypothetical protein
MHGGAIQIYPLHQFLQIHYLGIVKIFQTTLHHTRPEPPSARYAVKELIDAQRPPIH